MNKTTFENWFDEFFKESWIEIETDIDFTNLVPISTNSSLHIYEERYIIDNKIYRLLYSIDNDNPIVEILI